MEKLKIGVFALTSCYGCQLKLATVSHVEKIMERFEFVQFPMVSSAHYDGYFDIAFVEGSVSTEKDLIELQDIRKRSRVLVAMGSCAINGGVQSWPPVEGGFEDMLEKVYGDSEIKFKPRMAEPVAKHVEVDYYLPGCPPEEWEIEYFLSTFGIGTWPEEIDYPVCQECRSNGNPCILIEKGEMCLGPITRAGCNARCIENNVACFGCRGPLPHGVAWYDSLARVFLSKGYSIEEIKQRFSIFSAHMPELEERLNRIEEVK